MSPYKDNSWTFPFKGYVLGLVRFRCCNEVDIMLTFINEQIGSQTAYVRDMKQVAVEVSSLYVCH